MIKILGAALGVGLFLASRGQAASLPYGIHRSAADQEYLLIQQGHFDEAIATCNQLIQSNPDYYGHYALRGLAHLKKGEYDEAVADYSHAIGIEPGNWQLYADRGYVLKDQRSFEKAMADFDKALSLHEDATVRAHRGLILEWKTRYEEALADYDKALKDNASQEIALAGRGDCFLGLKRYAEALAAYDRYVPQHPDNMAGLFMQGVAYYDLGQLDQARPIAKRILESDPREEISFDGDRMVGMFDLDKRRAAAREALESARKNGAGENWSATFNDLERGWGQAIAFTLDDGAVLDEIRRGLIRVYPKLDSKPGLPESARRYIVQAKVYIKEQNEPGWTGYQKALECYNKLLEMAPWYPSAYYNAALIRAELKHYAWAVKDMKTYLELAPGAPDARAAQDKIYEWEADIAAPPAK